MPVIEKSPAFVPEIAAGLKVRLADPVLARVAVNELLEEIATAPNARGDGVKLTIGTPTEEAINTPRSWAPLNGRTLPARSMEGTQGVSPPEAQLLTPPPIPMLPVFRW